MFCVKKRAAKNSRSFEVGMNKKMKFKACETRKTAVYYA